MAVRIRRARAGAVPLPLGEVMTEITDIARRLGLTVQWQQAEGDPVAVMKLPPLRDADTQLRVVLEGVELQQDKIRVFGRTEPFDNEAMPADSLPSRSIPTDRIRAELSRTAPEATEPDEPPSPDDETETETDSETPGPDSTPAQADESERE